ncbi:MAG: glycoside hydrolase family 2 TIM barrel-domain containing protein, partial [Candidatus Latescibacteria bacterium]|nr:glycoside hydrolase family 2 TIM barrel-domain containing protein [Candidatus Latescibacterota bacterium]
PNLWSPDHPDLYTLEQIIQIENQTIDSQTIPFGIRKIEFSPNWGLKLNGQRIKMKGACWHHDAGPVGAAVPHDALIRRFKILKAMGCNAIRTAHNPFAPEFYNLCDQFGFMVMNEAFDGWDTPKADHDYGNYFNDWWERDLGDFIRRDRNHPSVVFWSIGNEVRKPTSKVQKQLVDLCHTLDPTRPVTQGGLDPTRGMKEELKEDFLDIVGLNGNGEEVNALERFHERGENRCVVGTEMPHTYQTRGVYRTKTHWRRRDFPAPWELRNSIPWEKFEDRVFPIADLSPEEIFIEETQNQYYQSSYDNASVRISARQCWQRTRDFDFMIGEFRWGCFDYLGETNFWPSRFANFGVIDICGFPKDIYYLYQSMWTAEPMIHLLPHWTHPGKEGIKIPIVAYTNCESVELFLNNENLGEQKYKDEQLVWQVPYTPGTLRVEGKVNGTVVTSKTVKTANEPSGICITPDKTQCKANQTDIVHLEIDIVDANGTLVPQADHLIHFTIDGPAKLIGVDNGDPLDLSPYKTPERKAFRGKCLLIVQMTDQTGKITITAQAEGLHPSTQTITSETL